MRACHQPSGGNLARARADRTCAFDLAVLYEKGVGVTRDLKSAYRWYATAASSGDDAAAARVTELAKFLKPEEVKTATETLVPK